MGGKYTPTIDFGVIMTAHWHHCINRCLCSADNRELLFWAEFSENGKRLGYKAILMHLSAQRIAEDDRLVQLAKEEFGTKFLEVFSYVKNGK